MSVVHDEAEHKQGLGDDHRHLELEKYALESILEVSSVTNVTLCAVAKHAVRVDGTMETHNHPATSADRIRWGPWTMSLLSRIWLCPYGVRLHGLHCLAEPSSYETVEGISTWRHGGLSF